MTDKRKDEILTARMHLENFNVALGNAMVEMLKKRLAPIEKNV